jgi:hypothetical protein
MQVFAVGFGPFLRKNPCICCLVLAKITAANANKLLSVSQNSEITFFLTPKPDYLLFSDWACGGNTYENKAVTI